MWFGANRRGNDISPVGERRLEEGYHPPTVSDLTLDSTGRATGVVCGDEVFDADAVIFAVGVSGMQKIVSSSPSLHSQSNSGHQQSGGSGCTLRLGCGLTAKLLVPPMLASGSMLDVLTFRRCMMSTAMPGTVEADFTTLTSFYP